VNPAKSLEYAAIGDSRVIAAIVAPDAAPEWAQWLEEIGFIPGERATVMARGAPGGDPLVVRVGLSTFALRRAEAACVLLATPDLAPG
jgi:ferrous iron transport protein A